MRSIYIGWPPSTIKNLVESTFTEFSPEQLQQAAFYLQNLADEAMKRKEMTQLQGDNQTAYGESEDERGPED